MKEKDNFLMKKEWGYQLFDEECPVDDETAGKMLKLLYARILGFDYFPDLEAGDRREVNKWLRTVEENEASYQQKCKTNAENRAQALTTVNDRQRPSTTDDDRQRIDTDNDSDSDTDIYKDINSPLPPSKGKRFVKPTVEEVRAYCSERGNKVSAEDFVDFYESKGWMIGKSPMKDWKACVRTWERSHGNKASPKNGFNRFEQRDYQNEDLEAMLLGGVS